MENYRSDHNNWTNAHWPSQNRQNKCVKNRLDSVAINVMTLKSVAIDKYLSLTQYHTYFLTTLVLHCIIISYVLCNILPA